MLANSSGKQRSNWWLALALPLWVLVGFGVSQAVLVGILYLLRYAGVPLMAANPAVLNSVIAAGVYVLSLAIVIGVPWWVKKYKVSKQELGLVRLPSWMDIVLAPAGFIIYLLASVLLVWLAGTFIPGIDMDQVQETGFSNLSYRYEYILAFVTLIVIAPLAEEALFRGYLYGKLRGVIPVWAAMLVVSVVFGAVHGQWNVAIDVFALSMVLCSLREITGNIWAGVLVHMLKNGLAFYVLFINPTLL